MVKTLELGLRIDVDTLRGTRKGVPALDKLLEKYNIKASFFFSVGPDNMGRNLWRLLKPAFLKKMLRSKAASLYGWDILLMGTCWPGPLIGERCRQIIRSVSNHGHETGLHAWDHYTWQNHFLSMSEEKIQYSIKKGYETLENITGKKPVCSASPGWITNDVILNIKDQYPFMYNSDCRGKSLFYPTLNGIPVKTPQIPSTLPTYDEIIGQNGITNDSYNDYILSLIKPDRLNTLTIHAEVEGIVCLDLFEDFIKKSMERGITMVPLGRFLNNAQNIGSCPVIQEAIPGREGLVAVQSSPEGI